MPLATPRTAAALSLACLACLVADSALAGDDPTPSSNTSVTAAGPCQGALPAFAGQLRARPLGLQNEGTGTAFVTCALQAAEGPLEGETLYTRFAMANHGKADAVVRCTVVQGTEDDGADYASQAVTVPAGGFARMHWRLPQLPGGASRFGVTSYSCALPPDTGIGEVAVGFASP